jgi:uncharacterized paraquat-inducible protein A
MHTSAAQDVAMNSTLAQIAVAAVILGSAGVITQLFARAMYIVCPSCRTLNARRRQVCRHCQSELRARSERSADGREKQS